LVEPEAETEPDAVVPETKKQRDGEEEEEETLVQVKEAVTAMAPATDTEILVRDRGAKHSGNLCWMSYLVHYFIISLI